MTTASDLLFSQVRGGFSLGGRYWVRTTRLRVVTSAQERSMLVESSASIGPRAGCLCGHVPTMRPRLRTELRRIARKHPRWGWRMAYRLLRRDTTNPWTSVNHNRIQWLWREEGLRRPVRTTERRRTRIEDSERLRAVHPNQVSAIDFQFDSTHDGRQLKSLHIVDEHTREALAMQVGRSCTADEVVDGLGGLVARRGAPVHLRMDNGPEMIAWALRDYCGLAGTRTTYIEPGSPWENPFVESFNSRVRDELFNVEEFATLLEAQVIVEA